MRDFPFYQFRSRAGVVKVALQNDCAIRWANLAGAADAVQVVGGYDCGAATGEWIVDNV